MLCNDLISQSLTKEKLQAVAKQLAFVCQEQDIIALYGDLGAGKTAFSRAFIQALTNAETEVPSPTFTLVQMYDCEVPEKQGIIVWHFDLYRLKSADEIYEIGFEEALSDGISLIEWPERAKGLLPKNRLEIMIEMTPNNPNERILTFKPMGQFEKRIKEIEKCLNV